MPRQYAIALDRQIYRAVRGHTPADPADLVGILSYVDSQEKMLLSCEELAGGLARLIEAGWIAGAAQHRFYEPAQPGASGAFTGISTEEYEAACRDYHNLMEAILQQAETGAGFTRPKLILRWRLNDDAYGTEADEDAVEAFAEAIEPALAASGLAEVNGFEYGPGFIDILVFGRETDDDVDAVYSLVADTFRAYGRPRGSYIVRCYEESGREVISDEIA